MPSSRVRRLGDLATRAVGMHRQPSRERLREHQPDWRTVRRHDSGAGREPTADGAGQRQTSTEPTSGGSKVRSGFLATDSGDLRAGRHQATLRRSRGRSGQDRQGQACAERAVPEPRVTGHHRRGGRAPVDRVQPALPTQRPALGRVCPQKRRRSDHRSDESQPRAKLITFTSSTLRPVASRRALRGDQPLRRPTRVRTRRLPVRRNR